MEQLDEEKFPKLMAYLNNPVGQRVRTNNHVERTNRMFRFREKVRYKWRCRRMLVRSVGLTRDSLWKGRTTAQAKATDRPEPARSGKTNGEKRKQHRKAA